MKLYMHPVSQHSRRVLMLARALGVELEQVPVAIEKGEHLAPEFKRVTRFSAVPVLDDRGFLLAESHAIMRYLTATVEGGERFYPKDVKVRAKIDQWLDWNHTRLNPPIQTLAIQSFAGDRADQQVILDVRKQVEASLGRLEEALADSDSLADEVSLATFSIASTLDLFSMVGGDLAAYPVVSAWRSGRCPQ